MKKFFTLFCIVLLILSFTACSKTDGSTDATVSNPTNETQTNEETKPFDDLTNPNLEYIKKNGTKAPTSQTIINEEGKEEVVEVVTDFDYSLKSNYDGFSGEYRYSVSGDNVTDSKFVANVELKMSVSPEGDIVMTDKEKEENNVFIENVIASLEKFKKEHTVTNETYIISDVNGYTTTQYPSYDQIRSDYSKLLVLDNGLTDFEIMYSTDEYLISYKVVFTEFGLASLYVTTISYK